MVYDMSMIEINKERYPLDCLHSTFFFFGQVPPFTFGNTIMHPIFSIKYYKV